MLFSDEETYFRKNRIKWEYFPKLGVSWFLYIFQLHCFKNWPTKSCCCKRWWRWYVGKYGNMEICKFLNPHLISTMFNSNIQAAAPAENLRIYLAPKIPVKMLFSENVQGNVWREDVKTHTWHNLSMSFLAVLESICQASQLAVDHWLWCQC